MQVLTFLAVLNSNFTIGIVITIAVILLLHFILLKTNFEIRGNYSGFNGGFKFSNKDKIQV